MNKHHRQTDPKPDASKQVASHEQKPLTLNEIRQRAYQKWEAAGKPDGDGVRFWLEAERELLSLVKR